MYTYTLRYILLCCAMAAVFAQDDKTESTSPLVWVLFALLFIIVGAMAIGMFFIAYHFHQRFKKIEIRFSRRGSISSERYLKNSDSRRSSKRSISSTGRYENNPIRKRRSRSPRSSPQLNPPPQQQNNNGQVVLPMDTIYRNLQDSQQHPQISYTSAMGHYETLAMYTTNGSVTGEERKYEESEKEQKQQHEEEEEVKRVLTMMDGLHKRKSDNAGDNSEDVPVIEASYITPLPDRTVTNRVSNGDGNTLEYSDVVNPSPPTPGSKEYAKVNSMQKGKRPNSTEEYTDPVENGIENMKRLKATSVISKSQDSSPAAASKQRRASESAVHRKDFEEWPIKPHVASTAVPAPPPHESDL